MNPLAVLRVVLGSVYVLFVPGYFLTQALFKRDEIDFLENITLSIVLSVTAVPLAVLLASTVFGVRINALNSIIIIALIVVLSVLYTRFVKRR